MSFVGNAGDRGRAAVAPANCDGRERPAQQPRASRVTGDSATIPPDMSEPFKTRFAPSPTGFLTLGNIYTALPNSLLARGGNGVFVLRIEDTDAMRGHERYAQALMRDLEWLGLSWDEGPERGGRAAPYEQSRRGAVYDRYLP